MKKLTLIVLLLVVIAGCSKPSFKAKLEDSKPLFTYKGKAYGEADAFDSLISNDSGAILMNSLETLAIEDLRKEKPIDVSKEVEEQLQAIKTNLGDTYDEYMKTNYGSEANFISTVLEPEMYLIANFKGSLEAMDKDEIVSKYGFKMIRAYLFTDEASAKKVSEILATSKDLNAVDTGVTAQGKTDILYTSKMNVLTEAMKKSIDTLKNPYDSVIYSDSSESYYVFVYSPTEGDLTSMISTVIYQTSFLDEKVAEVLKGRGFEVYDSRLIERLKKDYSLYFE